MHEWLLINGAGSLVLMTQNILSPELENPGFHFPGRWTPVSLTDNLGKLTK